MNKLYLLFILIYFGSNIFGQKFEDLIIKKDQDSIKCKITFVNDQNIFYQYKKKKHTKSGSISRDLVLDFKSTNIENVQFNKDRSNYYKKCDTCKNWIVLFSDDTIYYGLKIKFLQKKSKLIKSVTSYNSGSSTTFDFWQIKSAQWNGINYVSFYMLHSRDNKVDSSRNMHNTILGYYSIKGKASLINYTYATYKPDNIGISSEFGPYGGMDIITEAAKVIEINNVRETIPQKSKQFIHKMSKLLSDNYDLVKKIRTKELKYKDIEKIVTIYNQHN